MVSDDLSHWSDIFTWRQHHYQFIVNHYDSHAQQDPVKSCDLLFTVFFSNSGHMIAFNKFKKEFYLKIF